MRHNRNERMTPVLTYAQHNASDNHFTGRRSDVRSRGYRVLKPETLGEVLIGVVIYVALVSCACVIAHYWMTH